MIASGPGLVRQSLRLELRRSIGLRLAAGVVWVAAVALLAGLRVNVTRSLPLGLYVHDRGREVARGSLVIACLPRAWGRLARERGVLGPGFCPGRTRAVGKRVLAVGGDMVELGPASVRVNGAEIPIGRDWRLDRQGRPVPHHPWGEHRLAPNEVWLYSEHRRSFDSRHFGPLPRTAIRAVIVPVWTIGVNGGPHPGTIPASASQPRVPKRPVGVPV